MINNSCRSVSRGQRGAFGGNNNGNGNVKMQVYKDESVKSESVNNESVRSSCKTGDGGGFGVTGNVEMQMCKCASMKVQKSEAAKKVKV